jgi:hypothetical protein
MQNRVIRLRTERDELGEARNRRARPKLREQRYSAPRAGSRWQQDALNFS